MAVSIVGSIIAHWTSLYTKKNSCLIVYT